MVSISRGIEGKYILRVCRKVLVGVFGEVGIGRVVEKIGGMVRDLGFGVIRISFVGYRELSRRVIKCVVVEVRYEEDKF